MNSPMNAEDMHIPSTTGLADGGATTRRVDAAARAETALPGDQDAQP
jgi:hypothetical protein